MRGWRWCELPISGPCPFRPCTLRTVPPRRSSGGKAAPTKPWRERGQLFEQPLLALRLGPPPGMIRVRHAPGIVDSESFGRKTATPRLGGGEVGILMGTRRGIPSSNICNPDYSARPVDSRRRKALRSVGASTNRNISERLSPHKRGAQEALENWHRGGGSMGGSSSAETT